MDSAGAAPLTGSTARGASGTSPSLRQGLVRADGRADPAAVKDAFESMLLAEILKPLQSSLRESGLFPSGAQGDIYASLWQSQLGDLLAADLDLLPGWNPAAAADPAAGAAAGSEAAAASTGDTFPTVGLSALGQAFLPAAEGTGIEAAAAVVFARKAAAGAARAREAAGAPASRSVAGGNAAQGAPPAHLVARTSAGAEHPLATRLAPFEAAIEDAARVTGVESNWLRAVILQESAGRANAVSRKGAAGLMQLMPATARSLGVRDVFEPAQNIMAGARYLRSLFDRYGDPKLALAAYNAGPGRVEAFGGVPPFRETRRYIDQVLGLKDTFDGLARGAVARER